MAIELDEETCGELANAANYRAAKGTVWGRRVRDFLTEINEVARKALASDLEERHSAWRIDDKTDFSDYPPVASHRTSMVDGLSQAIPGYPGFLVTELTVREGRQPELRVAVVARTDLTVGQPDPLLHTHMFVEALAGEDTRKTLAGYFDAIVEANPGYRLWPHAETWRGDNTKRVRAVAKDFQHAGNRSLGASALEAQVPEDGSLLVDEDKLRSGIQLVAPIVNLLREQPPPRYTVSVDGEELDAEFEMLHRGCLRFLSGGGTVHRDYAGGAEVILRRLAELGIVIETVELDSQSQLTDVSEHLAERGLALPLTLAGQADFEKVRKTITDALGKVNSPTAAFRLGFAPVANYKATVDKLSGLADREPRIEVAPPRRDEPGVPIETPVGVHPLVDAMLRALDAKPFLLLPGISGTGKTQLARRISGWAAHYGGLAALREETEWICAHDDHFGVKKPPKPVAEEGAGRVAFLPVRPDWTEASAFWGHYNPLTGLYYPTEATKVVLDAWRVFVERFVVEEEDEADPGAPDGETGKSPTPYRRKTLPSDLAALAEGKGVEPRIRSKFRATDLELTLDFSTGRWRGVIDERIKDIRANLDVAAARKQYSANAAYLEAWERFLKKITAAPLGGLLPAATIAGTLFSPLTSDASSSFHVSIYKSLRPNLDDVRGLIGDELPGLKETATLGDLADYLYARSQADGGQAAGATTPKPESSSVDDPVPTTHFLILDEMNLARVEYYLSDLLSLMESGVELSSDPDGRLFWHAGELARIHEFEQALSTVPVYGKMGEPRLYTDYAGMLIDAGSANTDIALEVGDASSGTLDEVGDKWVPPFLPFPPNLAIIGTVNIDETTHAFSSKVLDRAFVFEFSEYGVPGLEPPQVGATGGEVDLTETCERLNRVLRRSTHQFGHRTIQELKRFAGGSAAHGAGQMISLDLLDWGMVTKVLTKVRGSERQLDGVLVGLLAFCFSPEDPGSTETEDEIRKVLNEAPMGANLVTLRDPLEKAAGTDGEILLRSARKIILMRERARATGFTSYF